MPSIRCLSMMILLILGRYLSDLVQPSIHLRSSVYCLLVPCFQHRHCRLDARCPGMGFERNGGYYLFLSIWLIFSVFCMISGRLRA